MPTMAETPATLPAMSPAVELDGDTTAADLFECLRQLRFPGGDGFQPLCLDREVRDFLVRVLRTR